MFYTWDKASNLLPPSTMPLTSLKSAQYSGLYKTRLCFSNSILPSPTMQSPFRYSPAPNLLSHLERLVWCESGNESAFCLVLEYLLPCSLCFSKHVQVFFPLDLPDARLWPTCGRHLYLLAPECWVLSARRTLSPTIFSPITFVSFPSFQQLPSICEALCFQI